MTKLTPQQIEKYQHEIEVKRQVCLKAGGRPYDSAKRNGVVTSVVCVGGLCMVCGLPPTYPSLRLHNHEKIFRSAGGKVSIENSFATCDLCHTILQQYIYRDKEKTIRLLRDHRNLLLEDAEQIYTRIKEWQGE